MIATPGELNHAEKARKLEERVEHVSKAYSRRAESKEASSVMNTQKDQSLLPLSSRGTTKM
jgi:hypothetical protein